jgi:hypothetical protein
MTLADQKRYYARHGRADANLAALAVAVAGLREA